MARTPIRPFGPIIGLLLIAGIAMGCEDAVPPIRTLPPPAATPTATPLPSDDSRFSAMSYPPREAAPCGQVEAPDGRHDAYRGNLKRITAEDRSTVVFELCRPDVDFLAKVASPAFGINDTAWLQDRTAAGDVASGTGPYRLERWTHGSEISLARADDYWGEPAAAERAIVRWESDPRQRSSELQAGTVDGLDVIDPIGIEELTNDVSVALLPREGLDLAYLGFGDASTPLGKVDVRRAIALGIDRRRMVEDLLPAGSDVASHVAPCALPHGCAGDDWYEFDPTLARETLTAAGYPDGFQTTLHYPVEATGTLPDPGLLAEQIRTDLSDNLGIAVELVAEPGDAYLTEVRDGALDGLYLADRNVDVPDVGDFLDPALVGDDPATRKALAAGAATASDDKRDTAYAAANDAIRANVPIVPIAHVGSMAAFRADVDGASASPLGIESLAPLKPGDRRQFVWLTSTEPRGLYCPDEVDPATSLVCSQLVESLYAYRPTSAEPVPRLAEACTPNKDLTTWTCSLREGITFHDGARFDADDVVLSFAVQWDAEHPLHVGDFATFGAWFGGFLNPPATGG